MESNQLQKTDAEKQLLRVIAKPYLNSPALFLEMLKKKPALSVRNWANRLDLSFLHCKEMASPQEFFPFGRLDGINELLEYLEPKRSRADLPIHTLDLRGHAFDSFDVVQISRNNGPLSFGKIQVCNLDLSNNYISTLTPELFYNQKNDSRMWVNLNGNPIMSVDDRIFDVVQHLRGQMKSLQIDLTDCCII